MAKKLGEMVDADTGSDAAIHEELLDNPEADRELSKRAIERAMARGSSRADAERLYRKRTG
jgi:hypothetical protein